MEQATGVKLKSLICIEYPGIVKNNEKMLNTLGGIKKISEVYSEENRRMELRFRPSDIYCKPTCGERHNSTSLLIKVIRRRKKVNVNAGSSQDDEENTYKIEPVGVIHTTFKFENLCDFQYLPVLRGPDGLTSIYSSLLPKGIVKSSWMDGQATLFLPPATFSRMDTPQDYRYRKDVVSFKTKSGKSSSNIVCRTRQKRTHYAIFKSYKGALSQALCKFLNESLYSNVKKEFDCRPIWSKTALRVRTGVTKDQLKYVLPTMSFYFNTGPWRNMWVVFGYDPRTDPKAWIYQTFDFRIRQAGGIKNKVEAKRSYSNYVLPYKSVSSSKKKTSVIQSILLNDDPNDEKVPERVKSDLREECYIFRPGMVPPYRQMFYQYCDLDVPEIQDLLEASIVSPDNSPTCTEKHGWLPAGIEVECRNIISNYIEVAIKKRGLLKTERSESEDSNVSNSENEISEDNGEEL